MRDLLEQKLARFEQLEKDLVDPEVLSNPAQITAVAREHGSLAKLAKKYRKFKQIERQIAEAQQMIDGDDAEMRELAEAELPQLRDEREALWNELLELTVGGEDANRSRVHHGNPRRHRRRRSGAVRPRPVRNVQAPRRARRAGRPKS